MSDAFERVTEYLIGLTDDKERAEFESSLLSDADLRQEYDRICGLAARMPIAKAPDRFAEIHKRALGTPPRKTPRDQNLVLRLRREFAFLSRRDRTVAYGLIGTLAIALVAKFLLIAHIISPL